MCKVEVVKNTAILVELVVHEILLADVVVLYTPVPKPIMT